MQFYENQSPYKLYMLLPQPWDVSSSFPVAGDDVYLSVTNVSSLSPGKSTYAGFRVAGASFCTVNAIVAGQSVFAFGSGIVERCKPNCKQMAASKFTADSCKIACIVLIFRPQAEPADV